MPSSTVTGIPRGKDFVTADPLDMAALLLPVMQQLVQAGSVPRDRWPAAAPAPERFGLVGAESLVRLPDDIQLLDRQSIMAALSRRAAGWIRELQIHPVIGSTNTELMTLAARASVEGRVRLAELQVAGRGRRGRSWHSPFAANLAASLGFTARLPVAQLGGLSLVVGLAVLDGLEARGIDGLSLKWPNDVLLAGGKLGGILIEIANTPRGFEIVVGIGLNFRIPRIVRAELDQAVATLLDADPRADRNLLAAAVISSVQEFVDEFQQLGFGPFREAFDARHAYHRRFCQIVRGTDVTMGRVEGVDGEGALLLRTDAGLHPYHGGEVSLRPDV
jgi:BirA family biotin operon repressor/biotin-[acetyl-CoA-carboxylase] ligase